MDGTRLDGILVLLVEDDMVDRMACRRRLAGARGGRFRLIEADDGERGLAQARAARPDCILLDNHLPDMTGLEFLDRLGADGEEAVRGIPVLMLTGADSAAVATEAMRRGARDYLVKDAEGRYLDQLPVALERLQREQALLKEKRLAEARFRTLAAHQERVRENERQRIAREIHDELGGLLTGIKAYLSVLGERVVQAGGQPDPLLLDTAALAQEAIDTVRRVITDLRPSVLDQLGIWAALEWVGAQVAQRAGFACSCEISAAAAGLALDPERSIMLFRIVQEALTNVQRHAGARAVRLRADHADGVLTITIEDDGCGIGAGAAGDAGGAAGEGGSWGILGMRERSHSLGGALALAPRAGGGTVVTLRVPMEGGDGGDDE